MKTLTKHQIPIALIILVITSLSGCSAYNTPIDYPYPSSIEVITTPEAKCTLYFGNALLTEWIGSKVVGGLVDGSYKVKVASERFNAVYEETLQLALADNRRVEISIGSADLKLKSDYGWEIQKDGKSLFTGKGSFKIDTLWVGDYTVKIKVNPVLPEYQTNFTIAKQQTKTIEPLFGSFTIKTKSDYQNTLLLEGVEQLSWVGTKEFYPFIAGNYILKSKMFTNSAAITQSFTILPNENKTIEWEYGNITITTLPNSTCKLKRDGLALLSWQGSNTLDSIITGNYSIEIQEALGHPTWSENFTIAKDEQKSISIPYATLQITTNVTSSTTKIIYNGSVIKTITGSGNINNIVPGTYTLTIEASGYNTQSETITLSNNQTLPKKIQLALPFMQMVSIPGGTFTMGCTSEQTNCYSDELPTHQVTLSSYSIGKYEITQKQWSTVMGSNPSYFTGDNKPVEQVTWYEVVSFCNALSIREGYTPAYTINGTTVSCNFQSNGYRLPTEAEWEYAARGGAQSTNTQYSGSNMLSEVGWYNSNSSSTTHDVGTKLPNQLGIYDMSGNVWEWVWDYYGSYTSASQTNPTGPTSGSFRRLRGGSWYFDAKYCRSATRNINNPDNWVFFFGARVLRTN